jgi:pimeloyl-ACP methyl ester carboxylesterase
MAGVWLGSLLLLLAGPASAGEHIGAPSQGIVFVADGSAGLGGASDALAQAVECAHVPLCVQRVNWTHGGMRLCRDLFSHGHRVEEGSRLACQVLAYRQEHPGCRIYLVGHSCGAAVVLSACERLPADSVERIILLAPAVCQDTDLRTAACCARLGIDSFHSHKDYISLLLTTVGTSDGPFKSVAGRSGFNVPAETGCEAAPCQKIRQHAWSKDWCGIGHRGGHFDCIREGFLHAYIVPLLLPDGACATGQSIP